MIPLTSALTIWICTMPLSKQPSDAVNPFNYLIEPIPTVLQSLKITKPTESQRTTIQPILNGDNILLISPADSGKTAARLLAKMHYTEKEFFNDLLEAKLLFIKTRRF